MVLPPTVKDIFSLFTNFLTSMMEKQILKSFTFLYEENFTFESTDFLTIAAMLGEIKTLLSKVNEEFNYKKNAFQLLDSEVDPLLLDDRSYHNNGLDYTENSLFNCQSQQSTLTDLQLDFNEICSVKETVSSNYCSEQIDFDLCDQMRPDPPTNSSNFQRIETAEHCKGTGMHAMNPFTGQLSFGNFDFDCRNGDARGENDILAPFVEEITFPACMNFDRFEPGKDYHHHHQHEKTCWNQEPLQVLESVQSLPDTSFELLNDKVTYCCDHCRQGFETKSRLRAHLNKKHGDRCLCGKSFTSKYGLAVHADTHAGVKRFRCPICWKTFAQKVTMDVHLQSHTGSYKFSCETCGKKFPTKGKLNFHAKEKHSKPIPAPAIANHVCSVCKKAFTTKFAFANHRRCHRDSTRLPDGCQSCGKFFKTETAWRRHTREKICAVENCRFSFHCTRKMARHARRHAIGVYNCDSCDKAFVHLESLSRHNLMVHLQRPPVVYTCALCDKAFASEEARQRHAEAHAATQRLFPTYEEELGENDKAKCQTCDAEFRERIDLLNHELQAHSIIPTTEEIKSYECGYCDKRFSDEKRRDAHLVEIHARAPGHTCATCGKQFRRKAALVDHANTHTGYRPHVCKVCGQAFTQKCVLVKHLETHEPQEEKKFHCGLCGKLFKSVKSLKYHTREMHEMKFRFCCGICGKQFVRKCHFDQHKSSHSTDRPYKCMICQCSYKSSTHLKNHCKRSHADQFSSSSLFQSILEDSGRPNLIDDFIPSIKL